MGAAALSPLLMKKDSQLRYLNLARNHISSQGCIALAKGLAQCTNLQHLDLAENKIEDDGIISIIKAAKSKGWRSLVLSKNRISRKGFDAIAGLVRDSTTLESLSLYLNGIDVQGCIMISDAVMRNTSLRHLDLGANPLGAHGIYALASMLARNRTLQSLDLRGTDLCYVLEGPQSVLQSALPSSDNKTNIAGRSASPSSPTTNTISPPAPAAAISTPEHYSPPKKVDLITQRNSFGVLKLCEELGKPGCQLKHLLLSFNLFDDYSLRHLCQAIQQSQVEVLDLVNCGITQKGMEDVAKMISTAQESQRGGYIPEYDHNEIGTTDCPEFT
eukprot:jgi/Bigna1/70006/fgenesh1_pg.10_\